MPRASRFRIAAIADLFRQLQFASPTVRVREMTAAEGLVNDLDPARNYPQDFVVYRVTGTRPNRRGEPVTFVGEALVGDLVTLIQRLSDGLELRHDHEGRNALDLDEVASRLRVSTKTVQRYRRQGLVCHHVVGADGGARLACFEDALDRFVDRYRARLEKAGRFTRVDDDLEHRIIEEAGELRAVERLSLNEAALRLSRRHGRAHETIRAKLRRHDRRSPEPIFGERGPLTDRDGQLVLRARRRLISVAEIAGRLGRTPATIRRTLNRARGERLRGLGLEWIDLPTFDLEDAEAVILSAPPVREDLDDVLPPGDALALIAAVREASPPPLAIEQALLAGYNMLKRRAGRACAALAPWPPAGLIDRAETDLAWATMLKRRLVSLALPCAIVPIEQNLRRSLETQSAERIVELLAFAVDTTAAIVEILDPSRDQRLDRMTIHAMDRAIAARRVGSALGRAAARHGPEAIALDVAFGHLTPWQGWLGLRRDLVPLVADLPEPRAAVLRLHHGLGATPPLTTEEIAQHLDTTSTAAARMLQTAERTLLEKRRTQLQER